PLPTLEPEERTAILPRVVLIVRNPFRTIANSFKLLREYLYRPSFDPDSFVPSEDLLDAGAGLTVEETTRASTPPPVHRNQTVELLMNWKDSGSLTKSDGEVDRLVKEVLLDPNFKVEELHGFSAARENRRNDAADENSPFLDSFQTADIEIEVPSGSKDVPATKFTIPGLRFRKLTAVVRAAFSSSLGAKLHLSPFKLFRTSTDGEEERVYSELYNSDAFIEEHDKVQRAPVPPDDPDCKREKVVAALMFWSDATHLANFGTAKLWPIYMFLGNLSKYIRAQPNSGACQHVAYIPSLPDSFQDFMSSFHVKWGTQKKDILTHCRRELMHAVWKHLLDDAFLYAYKYGMVIRCADGVERRVYPRIFTYSADYPEKVLLATIRDKGLFPCPRCLTPKSKLENMGMKRDSQFRQKNPRTYLLDFVCRARDAIYKRAAAIGGAVVERLLKATSSVPTMNAFVERLGENFSVSGILVPDLLHEFELGVWKALLTHLIRVLYAAASDGSLVAELDKRFRDIPTFGSSTIRRFATNASEMKKLAGRDFEDLLQCSIPVFEGLLPEPYNSIVRILLYRTAEWHAFAKLRLHTDKTLKHLDEVTTDLGKLMRHFRDMSSANFATYELPRETEARNRRQQRAKGKAKEGTGNSAGVSRKPKSLNLATYKWHALADYVPAIRLFGGSDGISTQVGELAHRVVKQIYSTTNKRDADLQIAKRYRRAERARQALEQKKLRDRANRKARDADESPSDAGDSDLRYHISASKNHPINIHTVIRSNRGDPTYNRFLPKLQDHLLGRLKERTFDADMHEDYSDIDRNSVRFVGQKIYSVQTCRLYYTTYELQRESDVINPRSHPDIMLRAPDAEAGAADPYWYARVIGVFHANVWADRSDIPGARNMRRMDFLWGRLPKIGFVESTDEFAFSFVDPAQVVRGCHLIPAFNEGRTDKLLPVPRSAARCLNPKEEDDWVNFYVNIFVDRDMIMRYFGGGVGHLHNTRQSASPMVADEEPEAGEEDAASESEHEDEDCGRASGGPSDFQDPGVDDHDDDGNEAGFREESDSESDEDFATRSNWSDSDSDETDSGGDSEDDGYGSF
ncbi:hypothetical protein CVT26_011861, partial [Gymnopilus dilepis]